MNDALTKPVWSFRHLREMIGVFTMGLVVMSFLYAGTGGVNGDYVAVPGFDSFYHVKMAMLLPEIGLPDRFPWLTTTIFADKFVSHHYGFHLLLVPFLKASEWFGSGDPLQGACWAISFCFACVMMLFDVLLIGGRVRYRYAWLFMFLLMPTQFFGRHVFVRAICPSLAFMLLLVLAMFRRRYLLAGVVIFLYTQLYLGSVVYSPIIVAAYVVAGLPEQPGQRLSWKLPAWTLAGWIAGLLAHPYGGWDAVEFLRVQVLQTGLAPDISVGREWNSYSPAWFFVEMSAATLVLLVVSICLRARLGPRLTAEELALLLIGFVFLGLTLKARRFIEYWPIFSVLSCAYLWRPLHGAGSIAASQLRADGVPPADQPACADEPDRGSEPGSGRRRSSFSERASADAPTSVGGPNPRDDLTGPRDQVGHLTSAGGELTQPSLRAAALALAFFVCAGVLAVGNVANLGIEQFGAEWRSWAFVIGALGLAPATCWWRVGAGRRAIGAALGAVLTGAGVIALVVGVGAVAFAATALPPARLGVGWWWWAILAAGYVCFSAFSGRRDGQCHVMSLRPRLRGAVAGGLCGAGLCLLCLLFVAGPLLGVQRSSRCGFHLAAIQDAMEYLRSNSAAGDVVFTDDWDVFGVFFYYNHHNRFIVGLDPKFTHERDPVLWSRYARITQGKTPSTFNVDLPGDDGQRRTTSVTVRLSDVRDYFHADWVVVDHEHGSFARELAQEDDLVERVYSSPYKTARNEPRYLIFRVKGS